MAAKKTRAARPKSLPPRKAAIVDSSTHQALFGAIVRNKGSGAVVADELGCSQQSVSEWMRGSWLPRMKMQKKMKELYGIPTPWSPSASAR